MTEWIIKPFKIWRIVKHISRANFIIIISLEKLQENFLFITKKNSWNVILANIIYRKQLFIGFVHNHNHISSYFLLILRIFQVFSKILSIFNSPKAFGEFIGSLCQFCTEYFPFWTRAFPCYLALFFLSFPF